MSQPKEQTYSRRNYYIDKDFQTKFIMKFCGLVALGAVVTMALLYLLARQATTVSIVQSRITVRTTADFLVPIMVQTVIVVTVIVSLAAAAVTLFVSHKIAGPLYRFKQTFKELAAGNFSNQVRLRKGDQLVEVASDFNHMIASVRGQILATRSNIESARADLDAISEFSVEDSKRHQFMALKKKVQDAEKAVNFFRT
jgi:methyl-accepting chemotaxis protein